MEEKSPDGDSESDGNGSPTGNPRRGADGAEAEAQRIYELKRDLDDLGKSVQESKNRERELESKIELMAMDAQAQVENRDKKFLT